MAGRLKIAVLISGRGSNLQALIDAAANPSYPVRIMLVLSNNPDAGGLARAAAAGIPAQVIDHRGKAREAFDREVDAAIRAAGARFVCLAGFMRLLSPWFVGRWEDRLINIHPSLLPAFKGTNAHEQAIAAGVRFSGCTVHFVRAAMDTGPIIVQAAVPVDSEDTAESLAARVLTAEHHIYPLALRWIAEGRVTVADDGRVSIAGAEPHAGHGVSPLVPPLRK
jgi:phosphoribosylglycinamide formyltransferase-1